MTPMVMELALTPGAEAPLPVPEEELPQAARVRPRAIAALPQIRRLGTIRLPVDVLTWATSSGLLPTGVSFGAPEVAGAHLVAGLAGQATPDHPPPAQDQAAIRHAQGPVDELLDEDHRRALLLGQRDALEDDVDQQRGQPEGELVGDDEPRTRTDRARQREHLLLAARQRARALL